jgi:hypothetical protein
MKWLVRALRGFGRFWYDFVVGEDWRIAAGVVVVLVAGAAAVRFGWPAGALLPPVLAAGMVAVLVTSLARR